MSVFTIHNETLNVWTKEKAKKQSTWRIFSQKELHAATNNFNYDNKLVDVGGTFTFSFQVPPGYPHEPPKVKCKTKVYHPNIDLEGNVCLKISQPLSTLSIWLLGSGIHFVAHLNMITRFGWSFWIARFT